MISILKKFNGRFFLKNNDIPSGNQDEAKSKIDTSGETPVTNEDINKSLQEALAHIIAQGEELKAQRKASEQLQAQFDKLPSVIIAKAAENLKNTSVKKLGEAWSGILNGYKAADQYVVNTSNAAGEAIKSGAKATGEAAVSGYKAADQYVQATSYAANDAIINGAKITGKTVLGAGLVAGSVAIKGAQMTVDGAKAVGGAAVSGYKVADQFVINNSNAAGEAIKSGVHTVGQVANAIGQEIGEEWKQTKAEVKQNADSTRQGLRDFVDTESNKRTEAAVTAGSRVDFRNDAGQALENSKTQVKDNAINQKAMNKPLSKQMKQIIYEKLATNPQFSGENKPQFNTLSELQTILSSDGFTSEESKAMQELMNTVVASQDLTAVDKIGIKAGESSISIGQAKNNLGKAGDKIQQTANQVASNVIGYGNRDVKDVAKDAMSGLKNLFKRGKN